MRDAAKMKELGAGVHRAGFAYGGCVLKIALNNEGILANRGEHEAWEQVGRHYRNVFAPVHDHDKKFLWITQPRLEPIGEFKDERRQRLRARLETKMEKRGIFCADTHGGNIGVKKGGNDPYLFDFGFGLSCRIRTPSGERMVTIKGAPG